jgi:hypothetical protein
MFYQDHPMRKVGIQPSPVALSTVLLFVLPSGPNATQAARLQRLSDAPSMAEPKQDIRFYSPIGRK